MTYGIIVCAGNQSRFKSATPKALVEVNGKSLLQYNISALAPFCDEVIVVCSTNNHQHFTKNHLGSASKMVILSGKGSGDAVWQALNNLPIKSDDTCFILWGDCLQKSATYARLQNAYQGTNLIPCVREASPYVQICEKSSGGVSAKFSKFNEPITNGFHDLSTFYCNALDLKTHLNQFHDQIADKAGNYTHKHNNEMEFLDVFNDTNIKAQILEFENYQEFSFNTLEQLNSAIKLMNVN